MLKQIKSDIYHLMHPKMAFFLTSISKDGKPNVMACAWATPVSEEPPIMVVCVSKESYTAELIKQTKEFAINIPTKNLLKPLMICGKTSGRNTDKFLKAKLKQIKSNSLKTPLIDGCIGYIECKLFKVVDAGECYAFLGNVVHASADNRFFKKNAWTEDSEIPLHLSGAKMVYFKE
ncbi:flavin reductase [Dissulfurispira thermophila]|uniref:Flavin reductase n=2 Tax=root TaxID=1 RepID=A0A7G1H2M4_9BACT|nr:flavin reductase family protein [Dissulfurispira thermophila]BCB96186.1 flavin reductase [Dissulfurispira thermophila]